MSKGLTMLALKEALRAFRWGLAVLAFVIVLFGLGSIYSGKLTREVRASQPFLVALKEIGDLHVYRQVVSDYAEYWVDENGRVNEVYGTRSVKFVAMGTVDAVIPLGQTRYNVDYRKRRITFTLPSPNIRRPNIDEGLSYVWESSPGFIWERDVPNLYSDMATLAQRRLLNKALRNGIAAAARRSAEDFLRGLLEPEGWQVTVGFGEEDRYSSSSP